MSGKKKLVYLFLAVLMVMCLVVLATAVIDGDSSLLIIEGFDTLASDEVVAVRLLTGVCSGSSGGGCGL